MSLFSQKSAISFIPRRPMCIIFSFWAIQCFSGENYSCNDLMSVKEHITKSAEVILIKKHENRNIGMFLIKNLGSDPLEFDVYESYNENGENGPYLHEWWTDTWKLDLKNRSEGWKIILPTWIGSIGGPRSELVINPGESVHIWANLRNTDKHFVYRLETIDRNARILISEPYCF